MKKTLLAVALTAASMTAIADVKISGHANLKGGFLEDFQSGGVSTNQGNKGLTVGDAIATVSRFRILSSTEANGVTYASRFEFGVQQADAVFATRVNEVSASGSFGKVTLGQGSVAGDGATEEDFSGTYVTQGYLESWELAGDLQDIEQQDLGRTERLRYDSPAIGNLALSASINDTSKYKATNKTGNDISAAARYSLPNFKASIAMNSAELDNTDVIAGSIAGKMGVFNAALKYYTKESPTAGLDLEQKKVIVGYRPGSYSVAIDYSTTETDDKSVDAETVGLNFIYFPTAGVELYAGARNAQANAGVLDENAFIFGARVKF